MITRWTANVEEIAGIDCIVFVNAKKGKYVTYEDHEALLNEIIEIAKGHPKSFIRDAIIGTINKEIE